MTDYTRLSIWESDPNKMSWYDHVTGRKAPAEPFITPNTEIISTHEEASWAADESYHGLSFQDAWFSELRNYDQKKATRTAEQQSALNTAAQSDGINHFAIAPSQDPYYEYMFADAGLDVYSASSNENSIDDLSVGKEEQDQSLMCPEFETFDAVFDVASPPHWQPGTPAPEFDEPQLIGYAYAGLEELHLEGGHDVTESITAMDTMTVDPIPIIDRTMLETYPLPESTRANIDFFGTSHISNVYDFFDAPSSYALSDSKHFPLKQAYQTPRQVLKPVSPRERIQNGFRHDSSSNAVMQAASAVTSVASYQVAKAIRKRSASEISQASTHDDAVEYNWTKKARLGLEDVDVDYNKARSDKPISCVSGSAADTTSSRQTSRDFFNHKPLAVAPKGYAGQFDGMVIKKNMIPDFKFNVTYHDMTKSGFCFAFGDPRHPNGVYTHTAFATDPLCSTSDFTKENLPNTHPLLTCMNFAADMTIAAAHPNVVNLRSHDEEILRRESHIECAHARLEGVSVGYYRYYQGHLSVEEYHDAEMCIC